MTTATSSPAELVRLLLEAAAICPPEASMSLSDLPRDGETLILQIPNDATLRIGDLLKGAAQAVGQARAGALLPISPSNDVKRALQYADSVAASSPMDASAELAEVRVPVRLAEWLTKVAELTEAGAEAAGKDRFDLALFRLIALATALTRWHQALSASARCNGCAPSLPDFPRWH